MNAFLQPGIALLNRLRYPQKFLLISLVFLLPLFGVGYVLQGEMADRVEFVSAERQGLSELTELRAPLMLMQQHRGLSAAYLGGDQSVENQLQRTGEDAATSLNRLDILATDSEQSDQVRPRVDSLKQDWHALRERLDRLEPTESFSQHTALIGNLFEIVDIIGERSNLILDPEAATYYLIDLVVDRLPALTESMGQARGLGGGVAAAGAHSGRSWVELGIRQDQIQRHMEAFDYNLDRIFTHRPDLEDRLGRLSQTAHRSISDFNNLLEREFADPERIDVSAEQVISESTTAINQVFEVFDQTVPVLDELLAERQQQAAMIRAATLSIMAAVLLIMIYLFTAFYRGTIDTIANLQDATDRLGNGDLTARIEINSRDELGEVGKALNRMVESFEKVVKHVMQSTQQVAQAAEELSTVTEQTSNGVSRQRQETEQVASAMSELSSTVREVADNTNSAAESAESANDEAQNGHAELNDMITKVANLADALEEAGRVIRELQESSNEIGSVLDVINGIAEQTNLLALNAAIEAARAGESGRGFAVVADEVRSLAGRTQHSTEEIQSTIERLQKGADDAVRVIEDSRTRSGESVEMAHTTGRALESVLRQVAAINDMNTQIASATEQQTSVAEEMSRNVNSISEVSDEAATASEQTAESSQNLSKLSQELLESVSHFRVA